jgi:hypothetical protein
VPAAFLFLRPTRVVGLGGGSYLGFSFYLGDVAWLAGNQGAGMASEEMHLHLIIPSYPYHLCHPGHRPFQTDSDPRARMLVMLGMPFSRVAGSLPYWLISFGSRVRVWSRSKEFNGDGIRLRYSFLDEVQVSAMKLVEPDDDEWRKGKQLSIRRQGNATARKEACPGALAKCQSRAWQLRPLASKW